MMRTTLTLAALALTLTACGGSRATANTSGSGMSEYTRQVQGYLGRMANAAETRGYRRVMGGPVYGSLNDDGKASHEMTVVSGTEYFLFGACDNDCTDLDLIIYDDKGTMVRRDIATDDIPLVMFTANKSAKYRIEVVMAVCRTEPCRYGIQLNAK